MLRDRSIRPLTPRDLEWARCGSCHLPAADVGGGVWVGRVSLTAPAICVCGPCLEVAAELLKRGKRN